MDEDRVLDIPDVVIAIAKALHERDARIDRESSIAQGHRVVEWKWEEDYKEYIDEAITVLDAAVAEWQK